MDEYYFTSSLLEIAVLALKQLPVGYRKDETGKVFAFFEQTPELEVQLADYRNDRILVEPKHFWRIINNARDAIKRTVQYEEN